MGLTQSAAAVRMHFARHATISDHERDKTEVSEDVLTRYAALYGVAAQELRYGVSRETLPRPTVSGRTASRGVRESRDRYGVPDSELREAIDTGALLRMPPRYYDVAYELFDAMAEAGLGRDAQDAAEAWLTQLACGVMTPGFPLAASELEADARDAVAFLRRVYARRGLTIGAASPLALTEDPDSVSGRELERQMAAKKSGKKAG